MRVLAVGYLLAVVLAALATSPPAWPGSPSFRASVYRTDPCLAQIIERESAGTWDPTIDYGMGHGNVYEPYGIGQANPGTKMAPYGKDWRTNPWVQLRWARAYAAARYGSSCAAWAHWQRHHAW